MVRTVVAIAQFFVILGRQAVSVAGFFVLATVTVIAMVALAVEMIAHLACSHWLGPISRKPPGGVPRR